MQSQKEQQAIVQSSSIQTDDYGWLIKLNFLAIAGFALAFLILTDEARWLSAIGLFFCFLLIFVLNALSKQQQMILFQHRQIQDLLDNQRAALNTLTNQNISESPAHLDEVEQSRSASNITSESRNSENFEEALAQQNLDIFESVTDINVANTIAFQQENDAKREFESVKAQGSVAEQRSEHQGSQIQSEHLSPSITSPVVTSSAPRDISIHKDEVANSSQQGSLLKDLKGMTSLWSAFVEWFKGGNSIVRIAIIILLIGVILLLRFASEYWQPTLSTKMAGIAIAGATLTAIGYWLRNKRYGYAISIQGAGLGILFLVLFSAFKLAVITSITLSYGMLIALLAVTLLLALRQNALILSFIALGSGFLAPFILNTGSNNIPALFSYYLALNIALAIIAFLKPWRILNTVSLLATFGVGGLSIWMKAQPEQYGILSILVWLHFALYLFISIRYSQNIAQYKIAFKNIPLIDTALIFATPFMAFTLYAGLVYHNQNALSLASSVLALVYFVVGYVLHKKLRALTLLIQSFYGLGLTFLALILPFAFDAQWTSTGWAVQALALIWIGCRHHLKNSVVYGLVLLVCSTLFWLKSTLIDTNLSVLAICFLTLAYLFSTYIFSTPQLNMTVHTGDSELDEAEQYQANDVQELTTKSLNVPQLNALSQSAMMACFFVLNVVIAIYCGTVYQTGLAHSNAILMSVLTIASAVVAGRIYQVQQISNTLQIFVGAGLFYLAMIPLILWQADIIAIWWSLQAFVMLIATIHFALPAIRHASTILLWASAGATVYAIFDEASFRYIAATLVLVVSMIAAYGLWYRIQPKSLDLDRLCARLNMGLSFAFVPYITTKICDVFSIELFSIALPMLIWWGLLTFLYQFKHKVLDPVWLSFSIVLLFIGAGEIVLLSVFLTLDFQWWTILSKYQIPMLFTIILWFAVLVFCLKVFSQYISIVLAQFFMFVAVLLMAVFGGLLAWNEQVHVPMLLLLPVCVLLASLKMPQLQFLQQYWIKNLAVFGLGLLTLWWVSLVHNGQWNLPYITLFNPIDLLSIGMFVISVFAIKPLLQKQGKEVQIAGVAVMIITGLMLMSSVMLRSLHHYLDLPYWSIEAWQNGTVQASLTIFWVVLALVLTTFASKKALRHVWMLGIAVLALVIAKLIFLDLSHTHTITRIVSFIGSGLVMLVIGYFAPLPPAQKVDDASSNHLENEKNL